jgi:hypothetical protein
MSLNCAVLRSTTAAKTFQRSHHAPLKPLSHLRRFAAFPRRSYFFVERGEIAVQNAIFFLIEKKKICCRLYSDHGDCTAIMLQLHGVFTATA